MRKLLLSVLLICVITTVSIAQNKTEFKPEVKIGGTVFSGWEYNAGDAEFITKLSSTADLNQPFGFAPLKNQFETSKNTFFIERAYINVWATLTPQIKARVTPDIYSYTDGKGATLYAYQLKYAFVEYTPLATDEGLSLSFTGGVVPNTWIPNIERAWGYRGALKTLSDFGWTTNATVGTEGTTVTRTTASYMSTADLGLTAKLTLPKKYADLSVSVLNGNGYKNLGVDNRFKDIMVSGFIYPLAGELTKKMDVAKKSGKNRVDGVSELTVGGYAYIGKQTNGEGQFKNTRFGGMANFKYNFTKVGFVKIGTEVSMLSNQVPNPSVLDSTINGRGISTWIEFNPPVEVLGEKLSLVARYDMFDPNTNKPGYNLYSLNSDNGKQNLLLIGLFFKPASVLTLGFNYQAINYEKNFAVKYDGTPTSTVSKFVFNTILDF
jgi:hypothetical protein